MKVLFLYTELAGYFLTCCEKLAEQAEVHIVRWPVNKEAPFEFSLSKGIIIYDKENYSLRGLKELVANISPSVIVCSGWIDKDYLKVTRSYFGKIPTIMTCDTHWNRSARQMIAVIAGRILLQRIFSHAWVPGKAQSHYARLLGFEARSILKGFYSCDLDKFNKYYKDTFPDKKIRVPKRFVYAGRYYKFKGVEDLWNAFIELKTEQKSEWELWCIGTGDLIPVEHPAIKHFGFVQPSDLLPILSGTSVLVLPSHFEPWGVVTQEFAAAGFPLLLSREVGSCEMFLIEGKNGFSFPAKDKEALKVELKKITNLTDKELISMSEQSHDVAQRNSPALWAETLLSLNYENKKK
jgi:glycosyltransferase involved in cell wall biosynthesis